MVVISYLAGLMLPIGIIVAIVLMVWGYRSNIQYLNAKIPLGRVLYAIGNASSFILCLFSIYIVSYVMQSDSITSAIGCLIVGYTFFILGLTFYFVTGMRRAYDIGFPFWAYPVYLAVALGSRCISHELSEFLFLGLWVLLLQPGERAH